MIRNKIKTWVPDEHFVRPGVNDYPVCRCNDPDDAKWIAGRLNRAAELEEENENLKIQLESLK